METDPGARSYWYGPWRWKMPPKRHLSLWNKKLGNGAKKGESASKHGLYMMVFCSFMLFFCRCCTTSRLKKTSKTTSLHPFIHRDHLDNPSSHRVQHATQRCWEFHQHRHRQDRQRRSGVPIGIKSRQGGW